MADPTRPNPAHALHDSELIARAAAGDAGPDEARAATDLVTSCPDCAALNADLRLLAVATRRLGDAPTAAPRDFRLAPADAARLRRRGPAGLLARWWRLDGSVFRARVGTGLVAIGLVGVLLSAASSGLLGLSGGAATASQATVDEKANFGAAAPAPAVSDTGHLSTVNAPRDAAAGSSPTRQSSTAAWLAAGLSFVALVVGIGFLRASRQGRRAGP